MMVTRREFLKTAAVAGLCAFFRPPSDARAEPRAQAGARPWGFPLAFPAHFPEDGAAELRRQDHKYYLSVIRNDG